MTNYDLKLDLSKLEGYGEMNLKNAQGETEQCIVIPIKRNNIFVSDKGARYLDLTCVATPNSQYGSHFVTLRKTKAETEQEKATGERIRKPIVGNLKEIVYQSQNSQTNNSYSIPNGSTPQYQQPQAPQQQPMTEMPVDDTLPF